VYFVPDAAKGEAFYRDRLGFVTTDTFTGVGPFMRSAGMDDHHCLFMIQTAAHAGLRALHLPHGQRHRGAARRAAFRAARLDQLLGPRPHLLGSNWFWYFNSPLGCHIEYDADMDKHDDHWAARQAPMSADNSQLFLHSREWAPSGPPPKQG
jgi:catechol 2,3-dioxygenase-like lactoylglutathione lyase family enzyme